MSKHGRLGRCICYGKGEPEEELRRHIFRLEPGDPERDDTARTTRLPPRRPGFGRGRLRGAADGADIRL